MVDVDLGRIMGLDTEDGVRKRPGRVLPMGVPLARYISFENRSERVGFQKYPELIELLSLVDQKTLFDFDVY